MAGKAATLTVQILTDASKTGKGIDQATSKYEKFQNGVDKLVPAAAVAAGSVIALGTKSVLSASRTEQAMGSLESVFGKNADTVKGWAKNAADSVGLAESEYSELASVIGAQLNNMGLSSKQALGGTEDLISLGADLSATFGGSTTEAVEALSSALRGEADPAERYGLSLNQTAVNAELAAQGLDDLKGDALKTAKTQAILKLATEQAGGSIGQFGRESDTAAGQTQRMQAGMENAASAIGTALLPAVTAGSAWLAKMAKWVQENSQLVLVLGGIVGGLAAAIMVLSGVMKAYAVVQKLVNAAMAANPVGLVIAAIAVLVGLFITLWTTSEGFRNFFIGMWKAIVNAAKVAWTGIKTAAAAVFNWIRTAIGTVKAVILLVWNAIKTAASVAFSGVKSVIYGVFSWIRSAIAGVRAVVIAVWLAIRVSASGAWSAIRSIISGVFSWIRTAISNVKTFVNNVWRGILDVARTVWRTLKDVIRNALEAVLAPVRAVKAAFDAVVSAVRRVIEWIGRIKIPDVLGSIGDLLGGSSRSAAPSAMAYTAPTARGLGSSRVFGAVSGSGSGGITINVSGGLDSADAIARRVQSVLTGAQRRRAGVVLPRRA